MPAGSFIEGAASTAASGILGLFLGDYNDQRQEAQQERLTQIQLNAQKKMSDYNYAKQLEMWNATNYEAQMQHLAKAGLNPALLYGMGGGGGTTAGTGAADAVGGAHAQQNPGEVQQLMGMGIQTGMAQAQIELMKAQTNKTNVEATKIGGVDTQEAQTRIGKLIQETTNEQVKQQLMLIEKYINDQTKEANIDIILSKQAQEIERVETMERQNLIGKATQWSVIDEIRAKAVGQTLENELTKAQTGQTTQLTEQSREQIKKWAQDIAQGWEGLSLRNKELKVDAIMKEVQQTYEGRQFLGMKIGTHNVKEIADQIDRIMGISRQDFKK